MKIDIKKSLGVILIALFVLFFASCAEDVVPKDEPKDDATVNETVKEEEVPFVQSLLETYLKVDESRTVKVFKSLSELESWIASQSVNQEEVSEFLAKYDAKYFESKCLAVLLLGENASTSEIKVTSVVKQSENDKVNYVFTYTDTDVSDTSSDDLIIPLIAVELDAESGISEQNAVLFPN